MWKRGSNLYIPIILSTITAVDNPGGIIVLELNVNDFSLSEIAQIIESNDARLLSLYMNSQADSTRSELTLKINRMDIQPILQTFLRYDYTIKASFFESDYTDDLRERYNQLMNYLNIWFLPDAPEPATVSANYASFQLWVEAAFPDFHPVAWI